MKYKYGLSFLILLSLSITSIFIGASTLTIRDIISGDSHQLMILVVSRLPRVISILLTGIGLSISGLVMQRITHNRFVSPTTAATINFAQLGMLLALLFFTSATLFQRLSFAFLLAIIGSLLFLELARRIKFQVPIFVALTGMILGNVVTSFTTFLAYQNNLVQNVSSWTQGSFTNILQGNFELIYISLPFILLAFVFANKFTIVGMGEEFAKNLGLNYRLYVNFGLIIVSAITASIVVTVGSISFVGLIIPNLVSIRFGDNLTNSFGLTAIFGAGFLLVCDILGRLILFPFEIPISLTVGILGSVLFLFMLLRRKIYAT